MTTNRLPLKTNRLSPKPRRSGALKHVLANKHLYLMLVPFIIYYALFYFKPFSGLKIAFLDYKPLLGIEGSNWVGFDNFMQFFKGPYFFRLIRNTVMISLYNLLFGFPVPILLALLFYELRSNRFRTLVQTISYIPRFISAVVIAGMVVNFLSPSTGIVNFLLAKFGADPVYFLSRPEYFRTIYVLQNSWSSAGFGSIIYYSALVSIDTELFEAATIDGSNRFRQIWHISLPGILPTIAIMLIMQIGNIMNVGYEMIILLYQPVTYETADIIGSFVYRMGIESSNYAMSTAVGLFNGIISFVLVMIANQMSKRLSGTSIF